MLRAERLVRERLHVADAEVAIELVERRRAERSVRRSGEGEAIGGVDEQRHARTPCVVAAIRERRAVALRVEVAPRIETDSGAQRDARRERGHILDIRGGVALPSGNIRVRDLAVDRRELQLLAGTFDLARVAAGD